MRAGRLLLLLVSVSLPLALVVPLLFAPGLAAVGSCMGTGSIDRQPVATGVQDSRQTICEGGVVPGDPFGGTCHPRVTQPYGPTDVQGEPIVNGVRFHTGIDLACPEGTPVESVTGGAAQVALGYGGGFGNNVVVELQGQLPGDSSGHRYFVRYAHLAAVNVSSGAELRPGDMVGWVGSTGFSTGPHLHFEVDRDAAIVQRSVNPAPFLDPAIEAGTS